MSSSALFPQFPNSVIVRHVSAGERVGYDLVTSAYEEEPAESWQRIVDHVKDLYPDSSENDIIGLIGKSPIE